MKREVTFTVRVEPEPDGDTQTGFGNLVFLAGDNLRAFIESEGWCAALGETEVREMPENSFDVGDVECSNHTAYLVCTNDKSHTESQKFTLPSVVQTFTLKEDPRCLECGSLMRVTRMEWEEV